MTCVLGMPPKKITLLRAYMAAGDWRCAVLLAAKFPRLGAARNAVLDAREAYLRPDFQRQLGRDPEALIATGREAMIKQWGGR